MSPCLEAKQIVELDPGLQSLLKRDAFKKPQRGGALQYCTILTVAKSCSSHTYDERFGEAQYC